jgi:hypothetical protein
MSITVERDLASRLHDTVTLLVRGRWEPAERLAAGIGAAIPDILRTGLILATGEDVIAGEIIGRDGTRRRLSDAGREPPDAPEEFEGPSYVSDPVTVPSGQLLMIDFASTPSRLCRETPGILVRHLEEAGVRDAKIGIAPKVSSGRLAAVKSYAPVARSLLLGVSAPPRPGGKAVPAPELISLAEEWLRGQQQPRTELMALIISTEVPLTWDSLRPVVDAALPAGGAIPVLAVDPMSTTASVLLGEFLGHGVALNIAGKKWGFQQVATHMRGQRNLIRTRVSGLGNLAWAGVTASGQSWDLVMPDLTTQGEDDLGPMWYQVLSEAQLRRLGGPPPQAVELPGGRVELTIGEPEQWVPGHPQRDVIRAQARRLLRGPGRNGTPTA